MNVNRKIPLIIIVGPTAVGKSAIAEMLTARGDGVLINADARQMYRGIEVISAAPRVIADARLYSWKSVDEVYSFAEFVRDADREIADVWARGHVPIVVGGTGLYIDALVQRFVAPPSVTPEIRARVAMLDAAGAREMLAEIDQAALNTIDVQNPRRVSRALEVFLQTGTSITAFGAAEGNLPYAPLWIGVDCARDALHQRIATRAREMWEGGAVDEVRALLDAGHTVSEPGMRAIGVAEITEFLRGDLTAAAAQQRIIELTRQYARRQLTWFRRNKSIVWYNSSDEMNIWHSVHDFLQTNFKQF